MKSQLLFLRSILLLGIVFFSTNVKSQLHLDEEWVHTSGLPDTVDYSTGKVDGSGNIYVTTNTISATEKANILTTKYNSSGVVQWSVEKDNADENDYGSAIDIDGSGNVYVGAATWVNGTNYYDYMVIKYNSSGTQQWAVTYNGPGSFYDIPTDIFVDGSGNVYVTGSSYGSGTLADYCTIKYNSSGSALWTSRYDYSSDQEVAAMIKNGPSSSVVVIGASENSPGSWDFAAVKYSQSTGSVVATNRNSASGSGFDQVFGADVDASGNFYITGRAAVVDEGFNMRTVKIDPSMDLVWAKNYDHAGLDDESHGVVVDLDDNVYVTGWITNEDGTRSFETIKYNSSGTPQWHQEVNAENVGLDAYSLKISSAVDGNIIVAGNVDNGASLDYLTVIYNEDGDQLWMEQYDSPDGDDDKVNFVKADIGNAVYIGGKSYSISTATNRLVKYNWEDYIVPPDDDLDHPSQFTFFENRGQIIDTDENPVNDIKYYTFHQTPGLFVFDDKISYVWGRIDTTTNTDDTLSRIDLSFPDCRVGAEVHHASSQGGEYLNYFLPQCPDGITNVRNSDRLLVSELYDDVDLEYYFDNQGLKYYLIIKPGYSEQNDPISLFYDGADEVNILLDGTLEIKNEVGVLIQNIADAYQIDVDGDRIDLLWDADFISIDDFEVGFDLGVYDDGLPLVIEMSLTPPGGIADEIDFDNVYWSTVYGSGSGTIQITDVTYGTYHLPIIIGVNYPLWFPIGTDVTTFGDLFAGGEAYISRFGPLRASNFGVIIGGSGADKPTAIDINNITLDMYISGFTTSNDFYTKDFGGSSYFQDTYTNYIEEGFICQLNATGNLVRWSTYVEDVVELNSIDFKDDFTEFTVVGQMEGAATASLEELDGAFYEDEEETALSYIATFNNTNHLIWGTKYWGISAQVGQYDINGRLNIGGQIWGNPYWEDVGDGLGGNGEVFSSPTGGWGENGIYFTTFETDKTVSWATQYGGNGTDFVYSLTSDENGNLYFVGSTSKDSYADDMEFLTYSEYEADPDDYFQETYTYLEPVFSFDGYLVKFDDERNRLLSTLFGGPTHEEIYDIEVVNGDIWFVGFTQNESTDFPYTFYDADCFDQSDLMAEKNGFLCIMTDEAVIKYLTNVGWIINSSTYDIAYDNTIDKILTTGAASYNEGDELGFAPVWKPNDFAYYSSLNPAGIAKNSSSFITEWLRLPGDVVIHSDELYKYEIDVYPNPCSSLVNIEAVNLTGEKFVQVFDIRNKKVFEKIYYEDQIDINVGNLAPGFYLGKIQQENSTIDFKFIKL
ncbi:MAG: SBBP repeat-containing protein [Chitinophagales bacterium]|nr:SBBP repeat-containing protein [Chitinophagales bacterium]